MTLTKGIGLTLALMMIPGSVAATGTVLEPGWTVQSDTGQGNYSLALTPWNGATIVTVSGGEWVVLETTNGTSTRYVFLAIPEVPESVAPIDYGPRFLALNQNITDRLAVLEEQLGYEFASLEEQIPAPYDDTTLQAAVLAVDQKVGTTKVVVQDDATAWEIAAVVLLLAVIGVQTWTLVKSQGRPKASQADDEDGDVFTIDPDPEE